MTRRLTAVLSQGLSHHPQKRALEQHLVANLRDESQLAILVVPNLYDLRTDGPAASELRQIDGDMIVLSWMYPRGSYWILDFHGVDGQPGETQLADPTCQSDESPSSDDPDQKDRVIASRPHRNRKIYCLDLRAHKSAAPYLDEIRRIIDLPDAGEQAEVSAPPAANAGDHLSVGIGDAVPAAEVAGLQRSHENATSPAGEVKTIDDPVGRRWYPVIDFSRCTNCMECVDFCLFGVYGIDDAETILVELPDNCRKGCPACSRVCPEHAIIFPQHKTPAIAGAAVENGSLKIDLSKLFGAPLDTDSSAGQAARERDEQLQQVGQSLAGPDAISSASEQKNKPSRSRDELDDLIDELDDVDL